MCGNYALLTYCTLCKKWLCVGCRRNVPGRIKAAVTQAVGQVF